ncbi:MAG: hypothetical protein JF622_09795, partial [Terrabacter sp.]|nr:hypothetical protein [Terrabacter sp.]
MTTDIAQAERAASTPVVSPAQRRRKRSPHGVLLLVLKIALALVFGLPL